MEFFYGNVEIFPIPIHVVLNEWFWPGLAGTGRAEKEFMAVCELSLHYCPPPWGRGLRRYGRGWRRAGGLQEGQRGWRGVRGQWGNGLVQLSC